MARGDWQLLPWILGSRIPVIGRWKMLDNLRRTVSAPAAVLTLVVAWMIPGTSPSMWSAFILATVAVPSLLPVLSGLVPHGRGISKAQPYPCGGERPRLGRLADRAHDHDADVPGLLMSDAIVRTLVRVYVTHRRLLEWVTAAQAKAGLRLDLRGFCRRMGGGVGLAAAAAVAVAWGRPGAWPAALPF